jgi:hypothetical protein
MVSAVSAKAFDSEADIKNMFSGKIKSWVLPFPFRFNYFRAVSLRFKM